MLNNKFSIWQWRTGVCAFDVDKTNSNKWGKSKIKHRTDTLKTYRSYKKKYKFWDKYKQFLFIIIISFIVKKIK